MQIIISLALIWWELLKKEDESWLSFVSYIHDNNWTWANDMNLIKQMYIFLLKKYRNLH